MNNNQNIEPCSIQTIELNELDKMLVYSCGCGDYLVMGTTFIQDQESNFRLDKNLVLQALIILQARHPLLNSYLHIIRHKNKIYLKIPKKVNTEKIRLDWLDLTLSRSEICRSKLIEHCSKFNSELFSDNDLLWRVQVISYIENNKFKHIINLVMNQVISDGMSSCALSIEIVNIINSLIDQKECEEMKIKLSLTKSLYEMCSNLFDKPTNKQLTKKLGYNKQVKFKLPKKFMSCNEQGFILDLFSLNEQITNKLLAESKTKQTRLQGYFNSVCLYALKELYEENELEFPKQVTIELPASLRIRYEPNLDFYHLGFHTAYIGFTTDKNEFGNYQNVWADAAYIHRKVQEYTKLETGSLFVLTHSQDVKDFNSVFRYTTSNKEACKYISDELKCDLAVSNLGNYINERYKEKDGRFKINELYCSDSIQSKPKISFAILIHLVYWKGKIMFQIGANKSYFGSKYFQRFKELLVQSIDKSLN